MTSGGRKLQLDEGASGRLFVAEIEHYFHHLFQNCCCCCFHLQTLPWQAQFRRLP